MTYLSCIRCGEGKTEFEISHLELPNCKKCGGFQFNEAARPFSMKNWLLHPFKLYNYLQQEKFF